MQDAAAVGMLYLLAHHPFPVVLVTDFTFPRDGTIAPLPLILPSSRDGYIQQSMPIKCFPHGMEIGAKSPLGQGPRGTAYQFQTQRSLEPLISPSWLLTFSFDSVKFHVSFQEILPALPPT